MTRPRRSTSVFVTAILSLRSSTVTSAGKPTLHACPAHPKATMSRVPPAFTTWPGFSPSHRWPGRREKLRSGDETLLGTGIPRGGALSSLPSSWRSITADQAHRVAAKLYPLSTLPILIQNYLWTRPETCCPRGAAVGSIVQTVAIFTGVPIVAVATKLTGGATPFIEIDWLHGIEQLLMAVPVHVMAQSFRQAVLSHNEKGPLPKSATNYAPMIKIVSILYPLIFLLGYLHKAAVGGESWTNMRFLGGIMDPPTPGIDAEKLHGALSFFVWIPHWTMFIDFATQLRYMYRWADCIGVRQWKILALTHVPYAIVNALVALNHLNRDQIPALKLLHPIFVFCGSFATLLGTVLVWKNEDANSKKGVLHDGVKLEATPGDAHYPDWDVRYTSRSILLAAILSYVSLYFTR